MKFSPRLSEGIFLKRYKRFFADLEWQGQKVTAHVPNTGSLKGVNQPGQQCLFSQADNPKRKLKYTLQMIKSKGGSWVGVNTALSNLVVKEKLQQCVGHTKELGVFAHWSNYDQILPEFKISPETRLDFALKRQGSERMHFIEVKNVTLEEDGMALFPDAVTTRGQKHLRELMQLMQQGHTAELVFTVQRSDCAGFAPADDMDSEYGELLRQAFHAGLRLTPVVVELSPDHAELSERVLSLKI